MIIVMKRRGFTIVELLIVITIMGVLLVLAVASLRGSQVSSRDVERKTDVESIALSLENFYTNGSDISTTVGRYPSTLLTSTSASSPTVQALVVAGGGGGSVYGGGGGGGYQYNNSLMVSTQTYIVTVGVGGGGVYGNITSGNPSSFSTITANGGGHGVLGYVGGVEANGGCGGGGSGSGFSTIGGTGSQGGNGGNAFSSGSAPGGGGGAGGNGGDGQTGSIGGNGGNGIANSISGTSVTYAGGGGSNGTVVGTGGTGGGGAGGRSSNAVSGTNGLGGGGGGGYSGGGGSGIVIIRYTTGSMTATGGTITTNGGYTIHTFTSSGTFTVNGYANNGTLTLSTIRQVLRDIDVDSITAPNVTDPSLTFISATNNIQLTTGPSTVLPLPTVDQYIYQPIQSDGTLCISESQECRKFNLYYKTEADGVIHMVTSKNQ